MKTNANNIVAMPLYGPTKNNKHWYTFYQKSIFFQLRSTLRRLTES